jgi:YHS domain-containing protein
MTFLLKCIRTLTLSIGLAVAAIGATAAVSTAHAATKPAVFVEHAQNGAADGYDVTSFFTGTPVRGTAEFTAVHNGATYRFANAANKARFVANPTAYEPQYGGYCAWALAQGRTAPGRPQFWRVVNNKLYFNYDAGIQQRWSRDIPGFIASANANWPSVLTK